MRINIFHSIDKRVLADTINEWLDAHEHEVEIVKMAQSIENDTMIITFLWKLKEQF